ncbi:MAG: 50S ribosomal protein L25 [Planctomycetota bacterium]|nr:50S ribosomal protein L25 [Planctomycetota bacterium]
MADAVKIRVEARDSAKNKGTGTRVSRRLRKQGKVPAIIYGHKQVPQPISLVKEDVQRMIKAQTHLAELTIGDAVETVLVRDVQWDHLGREIIHLDFARVSADESIETEVRLDFRGVAAGVAEGGILEPLLHELKVSCLAASIPDVIRVDVTALQIGHAIHVRDLVMPENVTALEEPDKLVVHVSTRAAVVEAVPEGEAAAVQPEVIKPERKEKED